MSENDSFIDEVTDEVRRDQLFKLFKKYAWILVLIVVAIVGGTAYNEYSKSTAMANAQKTGDEIRAAIVDQDVAALGTIAAGDTPATVLAGFAQAELLADADDIDGAVAALSVIANNKDISIAYTDLAKLKALMLDGTNMEAAARDVILDQITAQDGPYRLLAIEQRAFQHLRDGNAEAALSDFALILRDEQATQPLRNRAEQLTVALGGNPAVTTG